MSGNYSMDLSVELERLLRPHLKLLKAGDPLERDADLAALGLDSLSSINFLFDIEKEFNLTLPDELLAEETFRTLASLEKAIGGLIRADCA